jgi:hypothetical protein
VTKLPLSPLFETRLFLKQVQFFWFELQFGIVSLQKQLGVVCHPLAPVALVFLQWSPPAALSSIHRRPPSSPPPPTSSTPSGDEGLPNPNISVAATVDANPPPNVTVVPEIL